MALLVSSAISSAALALTDIQTERQDIRSDQQQDRTDEKAGNSDAVSANKSKLSTDRQSLRANEKDLHQDVKAEEKANGHGEPHRSEKAVAAINVKKDATITDATIGMMKIITNNVMA